MKILNLNLVHQIPVQIVVISSHRIWYLSEVVPKSQDFATKLKISFFGFKKYSKVGRDLQYPCAEYGTPELEGIRLFNVKLKVVDVSLVFFSLEMTLGMPREMTTIMGFRRKKNGRL